MTIMVFGAVESTTIHVAASRRGKARTIAAKMIGADAAKRLVNDYPSMVIVNQVIEILN
jgi:hypothetical protein